MTVAIKSLLLLLLLPLSSLCCCLYHQYDYYFLYFRELIGYQTNGRAPTIASSRGMHGFRSTFLVNAEVDSMGGVVDGGVAIGCKPSPRRVAIEKAQAELR